MTITKCISILSFGNVVSNNLYWYFYLLFFIAANRYPKCSIQTWKLELGELYNYYYEKGQIRQSVPTRNSKNKRACMKQRLSILFAHPFKKQAWMYVCIVCIIKIFRPDMIWDSIIIYRKIRTFFLQGYRISWAT